MEEAKRSMIKDMVDPKVSDIELDNFILRCKELGLDPISRQIFLVSRWNGKLNKLTSTIQTSIDGYRLIAERTGNYAPGREVEYRYDEHKRLTSCTAYVKKLTKDGTWHEVASIAMYSEYAQENSTFWKKMPHLMLAKCAESLALRKAFPEQLSGTYTEDEMRNSISEAGEEEKTKSSIYLNDKQKSTIVGMCGNDAALQQHVLNVCGVTSLDQILSTAFEDLVKRIKAYKDKKDNT